MTNIFILASNVDYIIYIYGLMPATLSKMVGFVVVLLYIFLSGMIHLFCNQNIRVLPLQI